MCSKSAEKLNNYILNKIQQDGALSVAQYMEIVLGHPEWGYYMRQDPFGRSGDFITAPEISQMFGEMIGLWLADIWMQFGSPRKFILMECGPGRGTLLSDALRVTKGVAGFHNALHLHLIETSVHLREKQKDSLKGYPVQWHETLETVPDAPPIFVVANEFFDALPISQYEYTNDGWCERKIAAEGDTLVWILEKAQHAPEISHKLDQPSAGKILELSDARDAYMKDLADRIKAQSGAGIIIDYGYLKAGYGDTFQAVSGHKFVDPLQHVGNADLTAHVNFDRLEDISLARGLNIFGKPSQGDFLKKLGIHVYASKLLASANEKQGRDIQKALHRLTHSDEMGSLFKVMGVGYGPDIKPAGF